MPSPLYDPAMFSVPAEAGTVSMQLPEPPWSVIVHVALPSDRVTVPDGCNPPPVAAAAMVICCPAVACWGAVSVRVGVPFPIV